MNGFIGTWRLVRLALWRDRFTLPGWILAMAGFLCATTAMFAEQYAKHPALLAPDTRIVVENPGMRVLGLVTGPHVGGYTLHRDALLLAVLAAMMSVLAVVRHTRQSEELGREEMLRAGVVGRFSSLAAAVVVALAADAVLAGALGLGLVIAGQPAAGSMAGGASIALVGIVFTGVAAVAAQLSSSGRGAIGISGSVLGVAFLLAALGNMLGTVDAAALRVTSAWPSWLSPVGWSQQMRPFADNLWWPLLGLAVPLTAGLAALAVLLAGRRDVGRGLWHARPGHAHAGRLLSGATGLVLRQQRAALLGWGVGLLGFGLVFGALSEQIKDLDTDVAQWYKTFGAEHGLLGAYWASMMQIAGMAVAVYGVTLLNRLHHDEAQGTLESVLGTAVSRIRWLVAYAVNALAGATVLILVFAAAMAVTGIPASGGSAALLRDLTVAAFVQLPAIAVLGAAVALLFAAAPRWSIGLSWALVVVTIFIGPMFGPALGLPRWLLDLSPFTFVPSAPAEAVGAGPIVGLSLAAALLAFGAVGVLRRRDLLLPA